ncbi:MAG: hypothetical protein M3229_03130, partial [Actinomycetota bacterium]|nr:hypothetical protein [Actinomycetota bacterium]
MEHRMPRGGAAARLRLAIPIVLLLGTAAGVSAAARGPQNASDVIEACRHKATGLVRIVASASSCRRSERPIAWNTAGEPGPAG